MYKERNYSPHFLSYSAVTTQNALQQQQPLTQNTTSTNQLKTTVKLKDSSQYQESSDLAFLRNTVGSGSTNSFQPSRSQFNDRKFDATLRQTTNNSYDLKNKLQLGSPYRKSRAESTQDANRTFDFSSSMHPPGNNEKDRFEQIMSKYQKKDETKEAMKLLDELKELKKKQVELKKQRFEDTNQKFDTFKPQSYRQEVNSPSNFSKKNKVQYYTPSSTKKDLSATTGSPQNDSYLSRNYEEKNTEYLPKKRYPESALSPNSNFTNYFENKRPRDQFQTYDKHIQGLKNIDYHQVQRPSKNIKESKSPLTTKSKRDYDSNFNILQNKQKRVEKSPNPYKSSNPADYQRSTPGRRSGCTDMTGLSIRDFKLGKTLGEGKFGTVYQAIQKKTQTLYALKKVPKQMIKSHMMVDQFLLEVKIQSFLNHQNILYMHTCFEDKDHVYIVLEYMQEGTLFLHLKKRETLDEKEAAIKLREVASAVQYLHENDIAHRDIKPENIVMSHGVCKLCDFGWATLCDERRKTYCGTFDYAAPEILQGTEYDMSVDLWCLGILAYEILVGKAPFYHISRKETMKKIMNCEHQKIQYPKNMSYEAKSFIEKLLKKNPEERLKSEDLLEHPFLKNAGK